MANQDDFVPLANAVRSAIERREGPAVLARRDAERGNGDWRPIGTAPRDGRSFLVGRAGTDLINRAFCMNGNVIMVGGKWIPTHWHPLPDPPPK
jgi:hypothetical protein